MSGVDMVKRLREIGRRDFIGVFCKNVRLYISLTYLYSAVGITGNALKEDQVEYMEAGLDRVLTKPVLERSLREMLRYALDRRKIYSATDSPAEEKFQS